MQINTFNIIATKVEESGLEYIDLVEINGNLKTQWMKKIHEPNIFAVVKEEDGDVMGFIK